MTSSPLVSVIVPCRDAGRWLRETLTSVLDQRMPGIELILVDDGSRDGSGDVAAAMSAEIRVLRQPPLGVSQARTAGTRVARGRYLQYLDADDVLEAGTLEARVNALEASGADVALVPFVHWTLQPDGTFKTERETRRVLGPRPDVELLTDVWWPPGAVLYRRSIVERVGDWRVDLPIIQDARFLLDAALNGATFVHVEATGLKYRVHGPDSLSRRDPKAFAADCHRSAAELHDRWASDGSLDQQRRKALVTVFAYVARAAFSIDRPLFDLAVARLTSLDPEFRPAEPPALRTLSGVVGYRSAEHVAFWWRRLKAVARERTAKEPSASRAPQPAPSTPAIGPASLPDDDLVRDQAGPPPEPPRHATVDAGDVTVLHVVYSFPPDPPGGTEIYVAELCRDLAAHGFRSFVAAPGPVDTSYRHDGIPVFRFACAPERQTLDDLYGAGDEAAAQAFERILDRIRVDVVHQHALSPACSTRLIRAARARALPVVFTYHTPTVSCQRGTLLQFGRDVCSGVIGDVPCVQCVLDARGINGLRQRAIASVPVPIGQSVAAQGRAGGVWTALRLTSLMDQRAAQIRELFATVDHFVAPSPWVATLLAANGVASQRISLSPHGITPPATRDARQGRVSSPVRLACIGRLDRAKGFDKIAAALPLIPGAALQVDVYGVRQHDADGDIEGQLRQHAADDGRLRLLAGVPHDQIWSVLSAYDAILVPSQVVETGPLVVLEAFAAGLPVIGSALGGIADKVSHGINGLLVQPHDRPNAWAVVLAQVAAHPEELAALGAGIPPVRTAGRVGEDMRSFYTDVVTRHKRALQMVHG